MIGLIEKASRFVETAYYIRIDDAALDDAAESLAGRAEQAVLPTWKGPAFLQTDERGELAQYFFIGNAINYHFWKRSSTDRYRYGGHVGSEAMWRCLADHPDLLDALMLQELTLERMEAIFGDLPLLEPRWQALREAGSVLTERYQGQALNLLAAHDFDAKRLVPAIMEQFASWVDVQNELPFAKRAQLFVAMLHGRTQQRDPFPWQHLDQLTLFADYHLPRGLRALGVLQYADELDRLVAQECLIERGSQAELELRAFTVVAGEHLRRKLAERGVVVDALLLDALLWFEARHLQGPHHLTHTTSY